MTGHDAAVQYIEKLAFLPYLAMAGNAAKNIFSSGIGGRLGSAFTAAKTALPEGTGAVMKLLKPAKQAIGAVATKNFGQGDIDRFRRAAKGAGLLGVGLAGGYAMAPVEKIARAGVGGAVFGAINAATPGTWKGLGTGLLANITHQDLGKRFSEAYKAIKGKKWVSPSAAMQATETALSDGIGIGNQRLLQKVKSGVRHVGTAGLVVGATQFGKKTNKKMMENTQPDVQVVYTNPEGGYGY